jgi:voltage-gated potassium channel
MENTSLPSREDASSVLNLMVIVLSVYVLTALLIDLIFKLPPETERVLDMLDNLICVFFLFEFCVRFYRAENKLKFMRWGWIDIISSIPTLNMFRAGRIFYLLRLIRVLRAFRSTRQLMFHIFKNRPRGTFTTAFIGAMLMVIFSSITILQVENAPNSNITTAEDAIWWAYVTITTCSYGEYYPVTLPGRIIAAILMTSGVGLFGTFTGFVASWFVHDDKKAHAGS